MSNISCFKPTIQKEAQVLLILTWFLFWHNGSKFLCVEYVGAPKDIKRNCAGEALKILYANNMDCLSWFVQSVTTLFVLAFWRSQKGHEPFFSNTISASLMGYSSDDLMEIARKCESESWGTDLLIRRNLEHPTLQGYLAKHNNNIELEESANNIMGCMTMKDTYHTSAPFNFPETPSRFPALFTKTRMTDELNESYLFPVLGEVTFDGSSAVFDGGVIHNICPTDYEKDPWESEKEPRSCIYVGQVHCPRFGPAVKDIKMKTVDAGLKIIDSHIGTFIAPFLSRNESPVALPAPRMKPSVEPRLRKRHVPQDQLPKRQKLAASRAQPLRSRRKRRRNSLTDSRKRPSRKRPKTDPPTN